MYAESEPDGFPARIAVSLPRPQGWWQRQSGFLAVHGAGAAALAMDARAVMQDGAIAIVRDDARAHALVTPGTTLSPVYARASGGRLAVPSGLVFVRLRQGTLAEARRAELERAGYGIDSIPAHAPQSAWLRSLSGDVAMSLGGMEALAALEGVENVEPQMIMEAARR